jgi:hypothetical protein
MLNERAGSGPSSGGSTGQQYGQRMQSNTRRHEKSPRSLLHGALPLQLWRVFAAVRRLVEWLKNGTVRAARQYAGTGQELCQ